MANPKAEFELTAKNRMQKAFDEANAQLKGIDKVARNVTAGMKALGGVFVATELLRGAKAFVDVADRARLLQNRLKLVTDSTADLNTVQEKLFHLSQDTRSSFEATVELYSRVARSSEQLGLSQERLLNVTKTINEALQVSGATAQEASAGLIQLSQGLASGALRGDELRSVLEQMPRLARAIADGMGITIGQLRQFGTEGKLSAETVIKALESQAATIDSEFKQMDGTVGQSVTNLGNSMLHLVGKLNDATGATGALSSALNGLSHAIDAIASKNLAEQYDRLPLVFKALNLAMFPALSSTIFLTRKLADESEETEERVKTSFDSMVEVYQNFQKAIAEGQKKQLAEQFASLREIPVTRFRIQGPDFNEALSRTQQQNEQEAAAKEAFGRELEQVRQFTLTRDQVELEAHQRRLEILRNALDQGLIDQDRYYQLSAEAAARAQERISQITQDGLSEREKFVRASHAEQAATVINSLVQMTAGVASTNKTMFKINKIAATASAIVNTAQGVTKALAEYPPPLSFVMAAAVAAAGAAQIQAIKATTFGGGTTPSLAGSAGTIGGQPVQQIASPERSEARRQTVVNVTVTGLVGKVDPDTARSIGEALAHEINNNDFELANRNSRQALTIRAQ